MRSTTALFVTGLSLLACLSPLAHAGSELAGSEWRPREIAGIAVSGEPEMMVRFGGDGLLQGHGGCNRFFGSYSLSNDGLEIGPIGSTRMACPQPVMDRELSFMQALENARRFTRERFELRLTDDAGNTIMQLVQTDAD